jgi:NADH dehydrogenase (ubiquinone) 1 alpha subcomplex subunit 9
MFGFEDNLLHKLAKLGNVFTANHMQERYWPVHVSYSPGVDMLH